MSLDKSWNQKSINLPSKNLEYYSKEYIKSVSYLQGCFDFQKRAIEELTKLNFSDLPEYQERGMNSSILKAIDIIKNLKAE